MGKYDRQITGFAGELFVAAELSKRGFQVSFTIGNAKAIDVFAYNPKLERTFNIQVKTLRKSNNFQLNLKNVKKELIYIFVLLNKVGENVDLYILTGQDLFDNEYEVFGSKGGRIDRAGVYESRIRKYKDNWQVLY